MKLYELVELKENLNKSLNKGAKGTIVDVYNGSEVEVEFIDKAGKTIVFDGDSTFTVPIKKLRIVKE
jgi:hypothetical protein